MATVKKFRVWRWGKIPPLLRFVCPWWLVCWLNDNYNLCWVKLYLWKLYGTDDVPYNAERNPTMNIERIQLLQRTKEHRCPLVDARLREVEIGEDGYRARYRHLIVICTESKELDGKWWRHASVSRRDKLMPTYDDLKILKQICIGDHLVAYQLFMPTQEHIDIAGRHGIEVLHLWACIDGPVTPDFSGGTGSI